MNEFLTDYKYTLMGDKVCVQKRETNQYVALVDFPDRAQFDQLFRTRKPATIEKYWYVLDNVRKIPNLAAAARITGLTRARVQQIQESFFHHLEKFCYSKDILSRIA